MLQSSVELLSVVSESVSPLLQSTTLLVATIAGVLLFMPDPGTTL